MRLYFCTYFDSQYLPRAFVMLDSLRACHPDSLVIVVAMDEKAARETRARYDADFVTVVPIENVEDRELLSVKATRTTVEYYWTCTPAIIHYSLKKFAIPHCTYVDADLFFFSDPDPLVSQLNYSDVSLTPHNYAARYDQSATSGIYCVQFMTFKNTRTGLMICEWWRKECIDWCFARFENGRFGDQKYLDDWPSRFTGVKVLDGPEAGIAPWNWDNFPLRKQRERYFVEADGVLMPLVFFHFHGLRFTSDGRCRLRTYKAPSAYRRSILAPYARKVGNHIRVLSTKYGPTGIDRESNGDEGALRNARGLKARAKKARAIARRTVQRLSPDGLRWK